MQVDHSVIFHSLTLQLPWKYEVHYDYCIGTANQWTGTGKRKQSIPVSSDSVGRYSVGPLFVLIPTRSVPTSLLVACTEYFVCLLRVAPMFLP